MVESDLAQASVVSAEAFELDIGTVAARRGWEGRVLHSLLTDPHGSFVAEREGTLAGIAQAVIRDGVWILSLLTVSPTRSRGGDGRALVQAALGYARGTRAAIVISSNHPRALRLYGTSGFRLEPTFEASGPVDPTRIPRPHPDIVEMAPAQLDELAPISRAVRGAAHTRDFGVALNREASVFALPERGFVVTTPGRGVWALAALDEDAGRALLWHALDRLRAEPRVEVSFLSGRQQWAIEVLLAARLSLRAHGAIATRGKLGPLHPYIPSPPFA